MGASVLGVYAVDLATEHEGEGVLMDTEPVYLLVMFREDGTMAGQPLTAGGMPSGFVHDLEPEELAEAYRPEIGEVFERLKRVASSLQSKMYIRDKGDSQSVRPAETLSDAEWQLACGLLAVIGKKTSCVEEETEEDAEVSAAAFFRTGEILSDERLHALLTALCCGESLVNEYLKFITRQAISCRKKRQYERAVGYHHKVLALREDDHVLFNLARVYFETEQLCEARNYLERALVLNPQLDMAAKFLEFLGTVEDASCR
ncbi:hypothetical protein [Oleidesulfovibrio sp.]|uniref:hypothetical protein n=1 Tax=Oleidesulfovibrio sp. TaxID=2909707 RepID=UPI003A8BE763